MRLSLAQLSGALAKQLAPVYLLSGDEPLQLGEAADSIRAAARRAGFEGREVFAEDTGIDWPGIRESAGAMSIFAERKIIEVRLPSAKVGNDGSQVLQDYCARPSPDVLLLLVCGKLASATAKSRWVQAIDKIGVSLQVWPLEGRDLLQWLQQRAARRGLQLDAEGCKALAARVEGNLLAAAQEIEKLFVLHGQRPVSVEAVQAAVSDNSRYDVFGFSDALLSGKPARMTKILRALQAEGVAVPVVLWAALRETRQLLALQQMRSQGLGQDAAFAQAKIWDKRKPLYHSALQRLPTHALQHILLLAAAADRQAKGEQRGDPWATLLSICFAFAATRGFLADIPALS